MPNIHARRHVPVHYLRANHASWSPPAVISFDTETVTAMQGDLEVHVMRLWCARFTDRRTPRHITACDDYANGLYPEDFAHQVHKWTRQRKTVWAYAHNLHFDLCTTNLVAELIGLGWTVTEFAVSGRSPFVRMKQADHVLTIADSFSWLPVPLNTVADAIGMTKPPLPSDDDTYETWLARCQADAEILHTAILALMAWWDACDLGKWNITGNASGWNAMRHVPTPGRILIRPDDAECDHDRLAIYGGKRYCWRSGQTMYGRFSEIDFEKAYTSVCRYLPLPAGRRAKFTSLPITHKWLDCEDFGVIAECVIRTDVPRWPCRVNGQVWYPVGEFTTTLAGPDIREARDKGCLVSVGAGWLHDLGYTLKPWATWCIESQAETNTQTPDVAKIVHRNWGRSAIGKWAQRGFEVVELGASPNPGWGYQEGWSGDYNVKVSIVDFGGKRYQVSATNQADNAYPAILAFVESWVRVMLGRAIDTIGAEHMVVCDTDGMITTSGGADRLDLANQATWPLVLRQKRAYRKVKVIGPQHLELDQARRRAGIPGSAEPLPDGRLWARTWPKLAWQLQNGRAGSYVRPVQEYRLAATYAPGWLLADGSVRPVELARGAGAGNRLLAWSQTRHAARGDRLGGNQHRALRRYTDARD